MEKVPVSSILGQMVKIPGMNDPATGQPLLLTIVDVAYLRDSIHAESSIKQLSFEKYDLLSVTAIDHVICSYMGRQDLILVEVAFGALVPYAAHHETVTTQWHNAEAPRAVTQTVSSLAP